MTAMKSKYSITKSNGLAMAILAAMGAVCVMMPALAADGWKPADNPLMTEWGKQVKPDNVPAEDFHGASWDQGLRVRYMGPGIRLTEVPKDVLSAEVK